MWKILPPKHKFLRHKSSKISFPSNPDPENKTTTYLPVDGYLEISDKQTRVHYSKIWKSQIFNQQPPGENLSSLSTFVMYLVVFYFHTFDFFVSSWTTLLNFVLHIDETYFSSNLARKARYFSARVKKHNQ